MVYTSIYREHKPICLTIACYARKYELYHVEHNEIIRNTNKNKADFANQNKLAANYVGKMLAIL